MVIWTIGPGIEDFDTALADGENHVLFESMAGEKLAQIRWRTSEGIYVPPVLPGRTYTTTGFTATPAGADTPETAPDVTAKSISAATDMPPLGGNTSPKYWKFTATQSAPIQFDFGLTYEKLTGDRGYNPQVQLTLYGSIDDITTGNYLDYSSSGYTPDYDGYGYRGVLQHSVIAGTTYYIEASNVWSWTDSTGVYVYLRVSDYGAVTDWIQPPDGDIVLNSTYNSHHPPTQMVYLNNHSSGMDPVVNAIGRFGDSTNPSYAFGGSCGFHRSFYGPGPETSDDARACCWKHARRRKDYEDYWWSADGSAGAPWTGTGWCPTHGTELIDSTGPFNDGVIVEYFSSNYDTFYNYQNIWFRVHVPVVPVSLSAHVDPYAGSITKWGAGTPPSAADNQTVEYEAEVSTIVGLAVAPDQVDGQQADFSARWLIELGIEYDGGPPPGWGMGTDRYVYGGDGGPEDLQSRASVVLDYSGGTSEWTTIDPTIVAQCIANEEADKAARPDIYAYDGNSGERLASVRATLAFPELFSDTVPPFMGSNLAGANRYEFRTRYSQALAMKLTVRPARYRMISYPELTIAEALPQDMPPLGRMKVLVNPNGATMKDRWKFT
jgi:hypothetical protein